MKTGSHVSSRERLAETTSAVGAGVLGVGIGIYAASALRAVALPILVVGLVMHAFGMTDRMRLEREAGETRPAWSTGLYWICWLALVAITIVALMRR